MSTKTYTVRIPANAPDITSEQVAQWLEMYVASPADLTPDPGAGERSLRLSLDRERVEQGARTAGEPEATFLRRLIATNVAIPEQDKAEQAKPEARPKPLVLTGPRKLRPEQIKPLVRTFEAGQSFLIRKTFRVSNIVEAAEAARFTEEERERLTDVTTEVINRRAPAVLVQNADIFALVTEIVAIEVEKIDNVRAIAELVRQQEAQAQTSPAEREEARS